MTDRIVFIHLPGEVDAVPAGRLTLIEQGLQVQASRFAYGRRYLERTNALPVDPVSLPLNRERDDTEQLPVAGLAMFGALRDAAPDAWGRRVIENRLRAPPNGLPESAYLDHAGPHRAGALDVRETPASTPASGALPSLMELTHLLDAAERVEAGEPVPAHLEIFFAGGPTMGGARPKAIVTTEGREWIAKFPSRNDPFNVPLIERATLELARHAGLTVPATRIETLADGRKVMLIDRFDRETTPQGIGRRHMLSALTLLALHEQDSPNSSYSAIADAIGEYGVRGRIAPDRAELFGRMIFNILVSNDDDHLRNHAFLYDADGRGWHLSPLYDVVPKPQISQDRTLHLGVGSQGRAARLDNALTQTGRFGLLPHAAARIIDRIVRAVRPWRESFEASGVPPAERDRVATAFRRASDIGMHKVERYL
jgi:serine/threonine-protein kinase HipA